MSRLDDRTSMLKIDADRAWRRFMLALHLKFNPEQPRGPDGRWVDGDDSTSIDQTRSQEISEFSSVRRRRSEAVCWAQYTIDLLICQTETRADVRSSCRSQAMERYSACIKNKQIPPLNY